MTAKIATVRKNKEGFTPRQVKAAMEARSAMHILNAPSTKSLKYAIRSGLIKNCPITEEAINHAEAIFGPDASTLKGNIYITDALIVLKLSQVSRLPLTAVMAIYHTE
ncbi:unnamed protein product, partial [Cylindrotheca closterium]